MITVEEMIKRDKEDFCSPLGTTYKMDKKVTHNFKVALRSAAKNCVVDDMNRGYEIMELCPRCFIYDVHDAENDENIINYFYSCDKNVANVLRVAFPRKFFTKHTEYAISITTDGSVWNYEFVVARVKGKKATLKRYKALSEEEFVNIMGAYVPRLMKYYKEMPWSLQK